MTSDQSSLFSATEDIVHAVSKLIRSAREEVWLVSPYVSLDKLGWLTRAMGEALARGVPVHLIVRVDGSTSANQIDDLEHYAGELVAAGLDLRCVPSLHAKVYWSESAAIITSLNLLASSMNSSIEVGIQVGRGHTHEQTRQFIEDKVVRHAVEMPSLTRARERAEKTSRRAEKRAENEAKRAARQEEMKAKREARQQEAKAKAALREEEGRAKRALRDAERKAKTAAKKSSAKSKRRRSSKGTCIRCGDDVPLNPARPFCRPCYDEWAQWENDDYKEQHCHTCGAESVTSVAKPVCTPCYRAGV